MDRSLKTTYNLRSLSPSAPKPAGHLSFAFSTSTTGEAGVGVRVHESSSSSAMPEQAQTGASSVSDSNSAALSLSSSAATEDDPRASWGQPKPQLQFQTTALEHARSFAHPAHSQTVASAASTQGVAVALSEYPHQISDMGGPTATAPFLRDLNLVAEAAKRAQMAIVMRDLEGITL